MGVYFSRVLPFEGNQKDTSNFGRSLKKNEPAIVGLALGFLWVVFLTYLGCQSKTVRTSWEHMGDKSQAWEIRAKGLSCFTVGVCSGVLFGRAASSQYKRSNSNRLCCCLFLCVCVFFFNLVLIIFSWLQTTSCLQL